jgi:polar amino acid transport system permease protein
MRYVILPQAIRITIPPLIGQFLNLTKNSSLAMTIGVAELTYQARQIESYTFKGFEAFFAATVLYLILSLVITGAVTLYGKKVLTPMQMR